MDLQKLPTEAELKVDKHVVYFLCLLLYLSLCLSLTRVFVSSLSSHLCLSLVCCPYLSPPIPYLSFRVPPIVFYCCGSGALPSAPAVPNMLLCFMCCCCRCCSVVYCLRCHISRFLPLLLLSLLLFLLQLTYCCCTVLVSAAFCLFAAVWLSLLH